MNELESPPVSARTSLIEETLIFDPNTQTLWNVPLGAVGEDTSLSGTLAAEASADLLEAGAAGADSAVASAAASRETSGAQRARRTGVGLASSGGSIAARSLPAAGGTLETLFPQLTPVTLPGSDGTLTTAPQRLSGRFELEGLLGAGGMGAVFRARDLELDESVALKLLRRELLSSPQALSRFRQEVKLARRVTHPNVARVYEIFEHEGWKFLTMELVEGETLAALLEREGPLPPARAAALLLPLCAGLAAAHAAGVLHRDLKPDNVLVARDGRVVISDFGIARALQEPDPESNNAALVGTPTYIAPEQLSEPESMDARGDLYAVGAILYELLTGKRVWEGETPVKTAVKRLMEPPPDPRKLRPELPPAVVDTVRCLLSRRPEDRYSSAWTLAQAIEAWPRESAPDPLCPPLSRPRALAELAHQANRPVAIRPLRYIGPEDDRYVAEALATELMDGLAAVPGVRVLPQAALFGRRLDEEPAVLGRALGLQGVVDGSVKRLGGKFSIQLRFSCGTSGFQLWAHRYSVGIEGVLEVSDEATSAIAKALSLDGTGTPRQGPTDPRAIELYLKARQAYHGFWIESTQRAVALFQEALLLAPNDPLLLAGAALAEARLATHFQIQPGQFNPEQLRQQAELHALKALESNHHSGEARLALAALSLHGGDTVQGAARLRDALQEAPGLADVHDLMGRLLVEVGELHAGRTHLELAVALEPRLVPARLDLGRLYFFLNDIPKSDEILAEALRASGSLSGVWVLRARLAMWARDQARARTVLEEAEQARFPFMLGVRQMCSVTLNGRATPEHVEFLKNAARHTASRRMLAFFNQLTAEIMALSHRDDEALQAIEAAVDVGLLDLTWLEHCPLFAHLKHHEIYRSAQQRLSLQASRVLEQLTR